MKNACLLLVFVLFYSCSEESTEYRTKLHDMNQKEITDQLEKQKANAAKEEIEFYNKFIKHNIDGLTTDDNFNNYLSFTIENPTDKKITSIEIKLGYNKSDSKIIKVSIAPKKKKNFKEATKFDSFVSLGLGFKVLKVRYEDGSFQNFD